MIRTVSMESEPRPKRIASRELWHDATDFRTPEIARDVNSLLRFALVSTYRSGSVLRNRRVHWVFRVP